MSHNTAPSPAVVKASLLQALLREPGYGLELVARVSDHTGGRVKLHQGLVYPALRAMVREGLLEHYAVAGPPARGGLPRIYYRITDKGVTHLECLGCELDASDLTRAPSWHDRAAELLCAEVEESEVSLHGVVDALIQAVHDTGHAWCETCGRWTTALESTHPESGAFMTLRCCGCGGMQLECADDHGAVQVAAALRFFDGEPMP